MSFWGPLMTLLGIISGTFALGALVSCSWSTPRWRGISSHFDGDRFSNVPPVRHQSLGDGLEWMLDRERGPWRKWTDAPPGPPPPRRVGPGELRTTFVWS